MSFTMNGQLPGAGQMSLEGKQDLKAKAMEMTMKSEKAPGGQMVMRMVDGAVYVDAGQAQAASGGKRWMKMDAKDLAKTTGQSDPFAGASSEQQNPAAQAALLSQANVKKVGTETIDGKHTTHYTGAFDVNNIDKAELNEQQAKALEKFTAMKVDKITMDVWATDEHQLVKFRQQATTGQGPLDLTTTVKDINAPVHVQAPPADQTQTEPFSP